MILNGVSIGNYSTAQLAAIYPNLFAFLKGPVGSIQVYGPKGSVPNLGASQPSGKAVKLASHAPKPAKPAPHVQVKEKAVPPHKPVVHKAAAPKKKSSFLSSLFPFPF